MLPSTLMTRLASRSSALKVSVASLVRPSLVLLPVSWVSVTEAALIVLSSTNDRSKLRLLPASSVATRCSVCGPSLSVPPERLASCAAVSVNEPLACSSASSELLDPPSSAPVSAAMPFASLTVPVIAGSLVRLSVVLAPVSLSSFAERSGPGALD